MTIILTIFNDKNQVFFSYSSSQTIKSLYQLATMQLQIFAVHIYYPFALKVKKRMKDKNNMKFIESKRGRAKLHDTSSKDNRYSLRERDYFLGRMTRNPMVLSQSLPPYSSVSVFMNAVSILLSMIDTL